MHNIVEEKYNFVEALQATKKKTNWSENQLFGFSKST
jgi:hypothetical protein